MRAWVASVLATSCWTEAWERVSTAMAVAVPPVARISRSTVEMVEAGEFGSGGKGVVWEASEVLLAAMTTAWAFG